MSCLIRLFEKKKELLSNLQKNSRTQSKEFTKILKDFPIIEGSKLKSLQTTLTKQPTLPLYAPLKDSGFNLVFNEQIIKTYTINQTHISNFSEISLIIILYECLALILADPSKYDQSVITTIFHFLNTTLPKHQNYGEVTGYIFSHIVKILIDNIVIASNMNIQLLQEILIHYDVNTSMKPFLFQERGTFSFIPNNSQGQGSQSQLSFEATVYTKIIRKIIEVESNDDLLVLFYNIHLHQREIARSFSTLTLEQLLVTLILKLNNIIIRLFFLIASETSLEMTRSLVDMFIQWIDNNMKTDILFDRVENNKISDVSSAILEPQPISVLNSFDQKVHLKSISDDFFDDSFTLDNILPAEIANKVMNMKDGLINSKPCIQEAFFDQYISSLKDQKTPHKYYALVIIAFYFLDIFPQYSLLFEDFIFPRIALPSRQQTFTFVQIMQYMPFIAVFYDNRETVFGPYKMRKIANMMRTRFLLCFNQCEKSSFLQRLIFLYRNCPFLLSDIFARTMKNNIRVFKAKSIFQQEIVQIIFQNILNVISYLNIHTEECEIALRINIDLITFFILKTDVWTHAVDFITNYFSLLTSPLLQDVILHQCELLLLNINNTNKDSMKTIVPPISSLLSYLMARMLGSTEQFTIQQIPSNDSSEYFYKSDELMSLPLSAQMSTNNLTNKMQIELFKRILMMCSKCVRENNDCIDIVFEFISYFFRFLKCYPSEKVLYAILDILMVKVSMSKYDFGLSDEHIQILIDVMKQLEPLQMKQKTLNKFLSLAQGTTYILPLHGKFRSCFLITRPKFATLLFHVFGFEQNFADLLKILNDSIVMTEGNSVALSNADIDQILLNFLCDDNERSKILYESPNHPIESYLFIRQKDRIHAVNLFINIIKNRPRERIIAKLIEHLTHVYNYRSLALLEKLTNACYNQIETQPFPSFIMSGEPICKVETNFNFNSFFNREFTITFWLKIDSKLLYEYSDEKQYIELLNVKDSKVDHYSFSLFYKNGDISACLEEPEKKTQVPLIFDAVPTNQWIHFAFNYTKGKDGKYYFVNYRNEEEPKMSEFTKIAFTEVKELHFCDKSPKGKSLRYGFLGPFSFYYTGLSYPDIVHLSREPMITSIRNNCIFSSFQVDSPNAQFNTQIPQYMSNFTIPNAGIQPPYDYSGNTSPTSSPHKKKFQTIYKQVYVPVPIKAKQELFTTYTLSVNELKQSLVKSLSTSTCVNMMLNSLVDPNIKMEFVYYILSILEFSLLSHDSVSTSIVKQISHIKRKEFHEFKMYRMFTRINPDMDNWRDLLVFTPWLWMKCFPQVLNDWSTLQYKNCPLATKEKLVIDYYILYSDYLKQITSSNIKIDPESIEQEDTDDDLFVISQENDEEDTDKVFLMLKKFELCLQRMLLCGCNSQILLTIYHLFSLTTENTLKISLLSLIPCTSDSCFAADQIPSLPEDYYKVASLFISSIGMQKENEVKSLYKDEKKTEEVVCEIILAIYRILKGDFHIYMPFIVKQLDSTFQNGISASVASQNNNEEESLFEIPSDEIDVIFDSLISNLDNCPDMFPLICALILQTDRIEKISSIMSKDLKQLSPQSSPMWYVFPLLLVLKMENNPFGSRKDTDINQVLFWVITNLSIESKQKDINNILSFMLLLSNDPTSNSVFTDFLNLCQQLFKDSPHIMNKIFFVCAASIFCHIGYCNDQDLNSSIKFNKSTQLLSIYQQYLTTVNQLIEDQLNSVKNENQKSMMKQKEVMNQNQIESISQALSMQNAYQSDLISLNKVDDIISIHEKNLESLHFQFEVIYNNRGQIILSNRLSLALQMMGNISNKKEEGMGNVLNLFKERNPSFSKEVFERRQNYINENIQRLEKFFNESMQQIQMTIGTANKTILIDKNFFEISLSRTTTAIEREQKERNEKDIFL